MPSALLAIVHMGYSLNGLCLFTPPSLNTWSSCSLEFPFHLSPQPRFYASFRGWLSCFLLCEDLPNFLIHTGHFVPMAPIAAGAHLPSGDFHLLSLVKLHILPHFDTHFWGQESDFFFSASPSPVTVPCKKVVSQ